MGESRLIGLALVSAAFVGATGFGTVNGMGQNAEHERITRWALGCERTGTALQWCLEPDTLDEMAGKRGSFGAIGTPDTPPGIMESAPHCDNGDHVPGGAYPHPAADARRELENCRNLMIQNLDAAVWAAGSLLDAQGRIEPDAVELDCEFDGEDSAKCRVLTSMGALMHASQDFYAHSNWTDVGNEDPSYPRGLGQSGPAPWISLRGDADFPEGLMTGCFVLAGNGCEGRVHHDVLNKDTGEDSIDFEAGVIPPGASPRSQGLGLGNFERAVRAAIADSEDKWRLLEERLIERYGAERGRLMMCAISRDDPEGDCG